MPRPEKTSERAHRARRHRRGAVAIAAIAAVAVVAAGLGIAARVEAGTVTAERERFLPAGSLITAGDDTWHLRCVGPRSSAPTVVFEAGLGDSSATWADLQDAVAESQRSCSYDRLGYGWSSAARGERDPGAAAAELRALLDTAGESGPFIVVAHSLGALVAREFAAADRADVAGLVLVDPTNERAMADSSAIAVAATTLQSVASRFGATRPFLVGELAAETGGRLPSGLRERAGFLYRSEALDTSAAELAAAAGHPVPGIDVPTIVVMPSGAATQDVEHYDELGPDIAFQTAETPAHYVHYVEPELVLEAIDRLAG